MRQLLFVSFFLWFVSLAHAEWSGTTADQMISFDDNEYARAVQILYHEGASTLHAFWGEDAPSDRELHYGRSADYGETWTSTAGDRIISFPDGNDLYDECSAAAGGDVLIVVWSEDDAANREVHYGISTDDGITWSSQTSDAILSDPASTFDTMTPSIACDADGVFHVVWHQATSDGVAEVHYSRSTDGGLTWSGASGDRVISFPDDQAAIGPRIAACEGHLFVVWREKNANDEYAIHVGISEDGGDTWSSEVADREISPAGGLMTDLDISAVPYDASDGVHVVYRVSYNTSSPYYYEIYSTSTYDQGATWSGESGKVQVSHDEGAGRSASNPDVHVRAFGGPFAVWDEEDDVTGSKEQHVSWFDGEQWTGATADSIISFPDGENGYRPSITGTRLVVSEPPEGFPYVFVAWTEFAGGSTDNYEVHLSVLYLNLGGIPDPPASWAWTVRAEPSLSGAETRFAFDLPRGGPVRIEILDAEGRLIDALRSMAPMGESHLTWKAAGVPAGRYTARVIAPSGRRSLPVVRF